MGKKKKQKLRNCGGCEECCIMLSIPELNKPKQTRCKHLGVVNKGCSIHAKRPGTCKDFQCIWTYGKLSNKNRPDSVGIMSYYVDTHLGRTVFVTETRFNAYIENPKAKDEIIELAEKNKMPIIIATYDGKANMMVL
jgi:Fe-S-cluster containining protein